MTNPLAYHGVELSKALKRFKEQTPAGPDVLKLFLSVIY
jgi:hypothetical protein